MHAVILKIGHNPKVAGQQVQPAPDANQKRGGSQWNPQDDSCSKPKELYICCHVRRVEIGMDDNDDSGGAKAATDAQFDPANQMGQQP